MKLISFYSAYRWANVDLIHLENEPLFINSPVRSTYDENKSPMTDFSKVGCKLIKSLFYGDVFPSYFF